MNQLNLINMGFIGKAADNSLKQQEGEAEEVRAWELLLCSALACLALLALCSSTLCTTLCSALSGRLQIAHNSVSQVLCLALSCTALPSVLLLSALLVAHGR